jgi:hypothetical protein
MSTGYAATAELDGDVSTGTTIGSGLMVTLKQFYCGLHGHDTLMHFEKNRVYLQCASCGHTTPGWALNERPPRAVYRGDARRHALRRPRFISARRIA